MRNYDIIQIRDTFQIIREFSILGFSIDYRHIGEPFENLIDAEQKLITLI